MNDNYKMISDLVQKQLVDISNMLEKASIENEEDKIDWLLDSINKKITFINENMEDSFKPENHIIRVNILADFISYIANLTEIAQMLVEIDKNNK